MQAPMLKMNEKAGFPDIHAMFGMQMESITFSCLQLLFLCLLTQDQDEGISMISVERGHT